MNPLLLPLVAVQGMWVRSRTEKLPPAAGPLDGTAGEGDGRPVLVGVLGESTAAGCGVDAHTEGFAGGLAHELARRSGRPAAWQVVGQNAATARRIRHRLLPRLGSGLDVAVLLAGVNDVLGRRPLAEWGEDLSAIVGGLTERAELVVVAGVPPFESFPSLPRSLARYLARRAAALDEVSRQVCAGFPTATWLNSAALTPLNADFFARDRFHPSGTGYRRWAEAVADVIEL
ncbi:SGNH/GDSL hydrolase family protein [Phytomonospora sp. NPDC050363]|uniref:SGNH/GDSL hydrolase family protein n=1 Tax=Phytomonospora sp. NPDC050363 TaxID=3155642 RepID=UPI0033D641D1